MSFQNVLLAAAGAGALLGLVSHASADVDAIVHLDRLVCIKESDSGGSEPYAWTLLVFGTRDSFTTGNITVVEPGVSAGAKTVIKRGMRAGERASMPAAQRTLKQRIATGESGFLAIVVVLADDNGLPKNAIQAGYRKFLEVFKTELGSFLKAQGRPPNMNDLDELGRAIQPKVVLAIERALSFPQLVGIFFGQLGLGFGPDLDVGLGFNSTGIPVSGGPLVNIALTPFTLSFVREITIPEITIPTGGLSPSGAPPILQTPVTIPERKELKDSYRLEGQFEVRIAVAPPNTIRSPPTPPQPPTPPRLPPVRPRPPGTQEP